MAYQYTTVSDNNFSGGIDARSSENQISPGFLLDLLNADVLERRTRKRHGYQGYAGNLPVRVTSVESVDATNQLCFTLDTAVDLGSAVNLLAVRSNPLVVYGRLSGSNNMGTGTYNSTTDLGKYFSEFTTTARKFLAQSTTPQTLVVADSESQLTSATAYIGITESTSLVNNSNEIIYVDNTRIDESTLDITDTYVNDTGSSIPAFVYYLDRTPSAGSVYVASGTGSSASISAATHQLSNFDIVIECYIDNGATRDQIIPDSVSISSTGTVSVSFSSSIAYVIILTAVDPTQQVTGSIGASASGNLVINSPTGDFLFSSVYRQNGTSLDLVLPDSIVRDVTNDDIVISITNGMSTGQVYTVFYEYGQVRSNQLCVTDPNITADVVDNLPQLTIWGLDHSEIYGSSKSNRSGWVNHIDSYRRQGEQRLVSGLGGNLFTSRSRDEISASYLLPQVQPNLTYTVSGNQVVGPKFWNTGDTPGLTYGYITGDNSGTNWATVSSVQYDSSTGWTKYTVSLPNKQILDSAGAPTTLSSVLSTTTGLEDWLTVEQMSYNLHNGSYKIRQVQDGTNQIFIWVENSAVTASDYDDIGCAGMSAIFSSKLLYTTNVNYLSGDLLISSIFGDTLLVSVISSLGTTAVLDGVVQRISIGSGLQIPTRRTSSVIPLRDISDLVRGDMLSYSEISRLVRIKYINILPDTSVTIDGNGTTAIITLGSGDTTNLQVGMEISVTNNSDYSGTYTVVEIVSSTQFSVSASSAVTGATANLVGNTIHIDEELEWQDTTNSSKLFTVQYRWIPVEAPDDSYNLTPSTHVLYMNSNSYSNQPFLRSTMVQDSMYFSNGDDVVYKYDGDNNYRAGLIPWQPGCFVTLEDSDTTKILSDNRTIAYSAISAGLGQVTITTTDSSAIPIGTTVRLSGSTQTYTVQSYTQDATTPATSYILFDRALDGTVTATGSADEIAIFRYYFRLNAVDPNNNIIASAVTGYQDHVVELTAPASVRIKLVGLPNWDVYDFDRLEVQIYRTKQNTVAPFYLVTTLPMNFNNTTGYLVFYDSFQDDDLTDLDPVNTALKGQELGIGWSDPLRAKYVTSIGNRLVLGNIRDYPQLDLQIVADATITNSVFDGSNLIFRKDNTDVGTVTDMVNRVNYQWKDGPTGNITSITPNVGTSFDVQLASAVPGSVTVGDWIYLTYSSVATTARDLSYSGWWQVASVTAFDTVRINLVGAAVATSYPDRYLFASNTKNVPVLLGVDGNLGMVNGDSFDTFDTMRRMSIAINATMRQVDIGLTGYSNFVPWLTARGGNDETPAGRLVVRQSKSMSTTMSVEALFNSFDLFINSVRRTSGENVSASTRVLPSRILASYENFPEIFDNPTSILDSDSDSAIDVNSADGQEITGIIPFFGETAFTASLKAAILVVFKTNSVYLVDINQKGTGTNPVQRLETEGLGCTAPYSIAVTKNGIMFANESGIYCLRPTQVIDYIGKFMERNWLQKVDRDHLELIQGHHFGIGRQYKLSVPILTEESGTGYVENSQVYVYDHTAETIGSTAALQGQYAAALGAWSRYDNHPATGWANLAQDAYFGSTSGRIFSIRRLGENTDYRDDSSAIDMQMSPRANDFGASGIRKVVDSIIVHYRVGARSSGTTLGTSVDLSQEFRPTTAFVIPDSTTQSGIDDVPQVDVISIKHSTDRRKGIYFQVQIANSTIDENIEVAGIDYKVGGLNDSGILQAKQTQTR